MSISIATTRRPVKPDTFRTGPPVAPKRVALSRKPFGAGLGERYPVYRLACTTADLQWAAEQNAIEEDREVERRYNEYRAQERLDRGLEAW